LCIISKRQEKEETNQFDGVFLKKKTKQKRGDPAAAATTRG
jgi:hypothetical protein